MTEEELDDLIHAAAVGEKHQYTDELKAKVWARMQFLEKALSEARFHRLIRIINGSDGTYVEGRGDWVPAHSARALAEYLHEQYLAEREAAE